MSKSHKWLKEPVIISAPMRLISGPDLAIAVSRAGGLGFLGVGEDATRLGPWLQEVQETLKSTPIAGVPDDCLPIGIGFLNWGADLDTIIHQLRQCQAKPYAVWLFAPNSIFELKEWIAAIHEVTQRKLTEVWVQVSTVDSALNVIMNTGADGLIVQGSDAGGHGLAQSASLMTLLPEVRAALDEAGFPHVKLAAAGGIMNGKGAAAARVLGAENIVMGTRFVASTEAQASRGYKKALIDASDGGLSTVRTTLYDKMRGTTGWPLEYNGRGITNATFRDWKDGMSDNDNMKLYDEATKLGDDGWGHEKGRMTTYAGTGVGLVKKLMPAGEIVEEVREGIKIEIQKQQALLHGPES